MMNKIWILDTNIIIKASKEIRKAWKPERVKCSYITVLEYPIASKYASIEIIYPDEQIWMLSLQLAILLRKLGQMIPIPDLLIGASAITQNLTLVTNDAHFDIFTQLDVTLSICSQTEFEAQITTFA